MSQFVKIKRNDGIMLGIPKVQSTWIRAENIIAVVRWGDDRPPGTLEGLVGEIVMKDMTYPIGITQSEFLDIAEFMESQ